MPIESVISSYHLIFPVCLWNSPHSSILLITLSNLEYSWQIDGETVADFIFLGSNITADGDCSHEIKECLVLGRKVMTNLDSILKKQRYYLTNKGPSSQGYGFYSGHVWM